MKTFTRKNKYGEPRSVSALPPMDWPETVGPRGQVRMRYMSRIRAEGIGEMNTGLADTSEAAYAKALLSASTFNY